MTTSSVLTRAWSFVAVVCSLFSVADAVEPQRLSDEERAAGFELLFNGKNLDGWQAESFRDDWQIHDGAIYCTDQESKLKFTTKPLPRDFELRFRWRGIRPGFFESLSGNDSDGSVSFFEWPDYMIDDTGPPRRIGRFEGIRYGVSTSRLWLTTVTAKPIEPETPAGRSQSLFKWPEGKYVRDAGDWNEGSIRCVGAQIECRLNGGVVFAYDVAEPSKSAWPDAKVAVDWVDRKQAGLHLQIACEARPIWVRDIRLCDLTKPAEPKR